MAAEALLQFHIFPSLSILLLLVNYVLGYSSSSILLLKTLLICLGITERSTLYALTIISITIFHGVFNTILQLTLYTEIILHNTLNLWVQGVLFLYLLPQDMAESQYLIYPCWINKGMNEWHLIQSDRSLPWEIIISILYSLFSAQLLLILYLPTQFRVKGLGVTYSNQASFHPFFSCRVPDTCWLHHAQILYLNPVMDAIKCVT